jgi:excisionase family DNA binding protein
MNEYYTLYGISMIREVKNLIDSYMTVKEAAEKWNLNVRTVQMMCADGRLENVVRFGNSWAIPSDVQPPADKRIRSGKYKNWRKSPE